jgi:hypothetical protein
MFLLHNMPHSCSTAEEGVGVSFTRQLSYTNLAPNKAKCLIPDEQWRVEEWEQVWKERSALPVSKHHSHGLGSRGLLSYWIKAANCHKYSRLQWSCNATALAIVPVYTITLPLFTRSLQSALQVGRQAASCKLHISSLLKGITQATAYTNPLCLNNSSSINWSLECPKLVAKVLKQALHSDLAEVVPGATSCSSAIVLCGLGYLACVHNWFTLFDM